MRHRLLAPAPVVLLLALSPAPALGQDAIALFDQGRALVTQEKWVEACPLFAEAHRLQKEAIGIVMNLGECYRHTGKTASSWSAFREAEFLAKKANDTERARYAHEQAAALEPKLSRLRVDAEPTPGLVIHRDGQEIGNGVLGTAFPIDPGPHQVEATAPGYHVWSTTLAIGPERDQQTISIPALGKASGGGPGFDWTGQRVGGAVVASAGVLGLAAGGLLGGLALSKNSASKADCSPTQPNLCHADGVTLRQTAATFADASTGAFVAGGVALATGIIVLATAPAPASPKTGSLKRARVSPLVGMGTAGLLLRGEW